MTGLLLRSALCVLLLVGMANAQERSPRAVQGAEHHKLPAVGDGVFTPGRPLGLPPGRQYGQIGQVQGLSMAAIGTADIYGHGPYDLLLGGTGVYPFAGFDDQGIPRYGRRIALDDVARVDSLMTGPDGAVYGLTARGRTIQVAKLDRDTLQYTEVATSPELDLPNARAGAAAGWIDAKGRLHAYFTLADGQTLMHDPNHHAATFLPYDGAGFWRGNIPRLKLYHVCFDSIRMQSVETLAAASDSEGEFLFAVHGMTILNLGADHPPGLAVSDKQATFRYFPLDPESGAPGPMQFIDTPAHVALRHPVINASIIAVPDRDSGLSNLIASDTGRAWFYRFTGEWSKTGCPIFTGPEYLTAEGVHLTLGPLCVISPGDMDRDGLVDLMAGNDSGHLLFLKNVGTATAAAFDSPAAPPVGGKPLDIKAGYSGSVQGPQEAMWGYTCPTVCDWNGDGLLDVVLNSITADYQVILQEPSDDGLRFADPRLLYCDGLQLQLAWRCQPGITNWGGERLCMIALDEDNLLRMFWRLDDENVERGQLLRLQSGSAITGNVDEFAGQTGRADIVPYDWDGDGVIDLMIGASRGMSMPASPTTYYPSAFGATRAASLLFFRNAGTNDAPVFEYARLIEFDGQRIALGIHLCSPAFVDVGRGTDDVLIVEELGAIMYYPRDSLTVSPPAE